MQGTVTTLNEVALDESRDLRRLLLQIGPGLIAAAALAAGVGLWGLPRHFPVGLGFSAAPAVATGALPAPAPPQPTLPFGALTRPKIAPAPAVAAVSPAPPSPSATAMIAANPFGALVNDRSFFLNAGPAVEPVAQAEPRPTNDVASVVPEMTSSAEAIPTPPSRDGDQATESAPLPPRRPIELSAVNPTAQPSRVAAPATTPTAAPTAPPDDRNIFDKLFGTGRPSGAVVASQPPQGRGSDPGPFAALFGASGPPAGYDKFTAVYDISARVVYMPDGTRLEAHSGLGDRLDDPRHVSERMRGATPPHLYDLTPREASFHGVQALRLVPVGDGDLFGRAGLLAHPFMLGPNGDSNGCVSFRNYDAFLRAYQNGQVKRLAVVARLS
jgi:hypothetical protein